MNHKIDTISKKITLLNKTALYSMTEKNSKVIIKKFTEAGIKVLEADFGWAWWKFNETDNFHLAYKSPKTPYTPSNPREKAGNYIAMKTKRPFFDSTVKKKSYKELSISRYMKSYIIVPIYFGKYVYGTVVLCYKKSHIFTEEELTLANALGNSTAQSITIHRLVENEHEALIAAEKQKATEVLLKEEKLKTEFIANTTHEFRTPLAVIRGNVELALQNKEPKEMLRTLKSVNAEAIHLSNMLADLVLIISRKNTPNAAKFTPLDIQKLIASLMERLKPVANKKNITISLSPKKAGEILVLGDSKYLERMFLNLIENAIIYGKNNGKAQIEIYKHKSSVIVKVKDNGEGISEKDLPHIFERFYRADKAHSAYGEHSGLGLAIVERIAEMHQGKVEAESTAGKGSTFTVSLPLSRT